jgi:hypothetical protein
MEDEDADALLLAADKSASSDKVGSTKRSLWHNRTKGLEVGSFKITAKAFKAASILKAAISSKTFDITYINFIAFIERIFYRI